MPKISRIRVPSKRLNQVGVKGSAGVQLSPRDSIRQKFISVLDWSKSELKKRFEQPGMNRLVQLESLLLENSREISINEIQSELGIFASDFEIDILASQIKIAKLVVIPKVMTVKEYAKELANLPQISRKMINQVEKLVVLFLTVPATSTSCERSFSALQRLGTYLRLPMKQKRLNHLAILHVHKEEKFNLNINEILQEFTLKTPERRNVFGTE